MKMSWNKERLLAIVRRFRKEVESHFPCRVNLVEILGSNENAHTTILSEILRFRQDNSYPFLKSFLELCWRDSDNKIVINDPMVETQRQYIDALIWEKGKYAVVIENKIDRAQDQIKQIERYIEAAGELCEISEESNCIFVVYLTADGRKKVGDWSLTKKAKTLLGYKDKKDPGRFIEMNYRDDILPWLKESVIVNCRYGEHILLSMLQQYIDYLENRFAIIEDRKRRYAINFLEHELMGHSIREKYDQLKCLADSIYSREWVDRYDRMAAEGLSTSVLWYAEKILNEDYSINLYDAFDAKVNLIQTWADNNGFHRPYKSRQYGCVFFEHRVGKKNLRMKLQIDISTSAESANEFWVQFFNNDYDWTKISVNEFPMLMKLFKELFPQHHYKRQEEDDERARGIVGDVGSFESGDKLRTFLDEKVKPFVIAFDRQFENT